MPSTAVASKGDWLLGIREGDIDYEVFASHWVQLDEKTAWFPTTTHTGSLTKKIKDCANPPKEENDDWKIVKITLAPKKKAYDNYQEAREDAQRLSKQRLTKSESEREAAKKRKIKVKAPSAAVDDVNDFADVDSSDSDSDRSENPPIIQKPQQSKPKPEKKLQSTGVTPKPKDDSSTKEKDSQNLEESVPTQMPVNSESVEKPKGKESRDPSGSKFDYPLEEGNPFEQLHMLMQALSTQGSCKIPRRFTHQCPFKDGSITLVSIGHSLCRLARNFDLINQEMQINQKINASQLNNVLKTLQFCRNATESEITEVLNMFPISNSEDMQKKIEDRLELDPSWANVVIAALNRKVTNHTSVAKTARGTLKLVFTPTFLNEFTLKGQVRDGVQKKNLSSLKFYSDVLKRFCEDKHPIDTLVVAMEKTITGYMSGDTEDSPAKKKKKKSGTHSEKDSASPANDAKKKSVSPPKENEEDSEVHEVED